MQDRYHRLSELQDRHPDDVPGGEADQGIARDPRFGMPVRILVLDEFQEYYDLGKISKDIAALLAFLVKVAPGAGVIVVGVDAAAVRASAAAAMSAAVHRVPRQLPDPVQRCARRAGGCRRWCWARVRYGEGLDSSKLLPQYKGVGILRGATDASPDRAHLPGGWAGR